MSRLVLAVAILSVFSCSKPVEKAKETASNVAAKVADVVDDITAPMGRTDNVQDRERQRFDARWRQLQSFAPGPNSPVGVVWIALSKPHYGIHGTKEPDAIGYTSSHGCIRLTNWDAEEAGHRIDVGVPVEFVDTKRE